MENFGSKNQVSRLIFHVLKNVFVMHLRARASMKLNVFFFQIVGYQWLTAGFGVLGLVYGW